MKTVIWKLTAGNKPFQETADEKREAGLKYIERLKEDGENIVDIKEEDGKFIIIIDDELPINSQ